MSKQRRNNASPVKKKNVHYEGICHLHAFATCTRQWQKKKDFEALLANKYVVKHKIYTISWRLDVAWKLYHKMVLL